ncbi:hypothetical protein lbkm_3465 [Lachnospiraceae bacterium KM106-2]|nr:hypothetical protein lbkm_3465 [Lachnospiraceae bacterium KM106-2]
MDQKKKRMLILSAAAVLGVIVCIIGVYIKMFAPSNRVKDLSEYYGVKKNEVVILMQDRLYERKAIIEDGIVYVDYETVSSDLNKRFFWDSYENLMLFTTPTEVIKISAGSKEYTVNKSSKKVDYKIVKVNGDQVYIAMDFIKEYSNIKYKLYKKPYRLVIQNDFSNEHMYAKAAKNTQIRTGEGIKHPILQELKKNDELIYVSDTVRDGFAKVMSKQGVVGYVKIKHLTDSYYKTLKSDYKEPDYTNIKKNEKINLVWHQVTYQAANAGILEKLATTKGVNVISPTWFSVTSEDGSISSLANSLYVERAHSAGVEVWALVDDFSKSVDKAKLLTRTSSREKLVNELIANAIRYNLDGINVDFEKVPTAAGDAYMEFLRELSVKCRANGIVLSIDNYVPSAYTKHYDRQEEGIVADYVITMAYDEHYAGSEESGSVSSISYVKNSLADILKEVPKEKVIMALPFYTRLWKEEGSGDNLKISSEAYSMGNAAQLMSNKKVKLSWNDEVGQYYGEFSEGNARYRMWLEDEKSYELKLRAVFSEDIAGVANWKLGLEKSEIWNVIAKYVK